MRLDHLLSRESDGHDRLVLLLDGQVAVRAFDIVQF